MGAFLTTFLFLQIILLFLYKSFIVDVAKKNEKNLVENTVHRFINLRDNSGFNGDSTTFTNIERNN